MQLTAEPIDLREAHNQWRPLVRIDPIGVTLHEQIGMDVNATFGETSTAVRGRKRQVAEFPESARSGHSYPAWPCMVPHRIFCNSSLGIFSTMPALRSATSLTLYSAAGPITSAISLGVSL
jgi:hypothetical protein